MLRKTPPPKHAGLCVPKPRAPKTAPLPITGTRPDLSNTKNMPGYILWFRGTDGTPRFRIWPGFFALRGKPPEGWVPRGSVDEIEMKRRLVL